MPWLIFPVHTFSVNLSSYLCHMKILFWGWSSLLQMIVDLLLFLFSCGTCRSTVSWLNIFPIAVMLLVEHVLFACGTCRSKVSLYRFLSQCLFLCRHTGSWASPEIRRNWQEVEPRTDPASPTLSSTHRIRGSAGSFLPRRTSRTRTPSSSWSTRPASWTSFW
jgi:hypothetical protein